jgi:hypothetical protein
MSKFHRQTRENQLRRVALRRGLRMTKSGRKDPRAIDYDGFMVTDLTTGQIALGNDGHAYSATIEDVECYLGERS